MSFCSSCVFSLYLIGKELVHLYSPERSLLFQFYDVVLKLYFPTDWIRVYDQCIGYTVHFPSDLTFYTPREKLNCMWWKSSLCSLYYAAAMQTERSFQTRCLFQILFLYALFKWKEVVCCLTFWSDFLAHWTWLPSSKRSFSMVLWISLKFVKL